MLSRIPYDIRIACDYAGKRRSSAKLGFSLRFIDLVSRPIVRARYKTCIDNREG